MSLRPYAVAAALALAVLLSSQAAQALPPTSRTVKDTVDPAAAYDITVVTARSAPRDDRPAVVNITYARTVKTGDNLEAWFDLDGDKVPDVHLSGSAFSEYVVRRAKSFTQDGRDISDQDCLRLSMAGTTSKIRLFPACLGDPLSYAVAVKSSTDTGKVGSEDWAPGTEKFTKKVLAAPLS